MSISDPKPMDYAELCEAARKLMAIDDAGLLRRFNEVLLERIEAQREVINKHAWHSKDPRAWFPVVGMLERYLGVPRDQAEAVAIEVCGTTRRSIAVRLIDEAFAKINRQQQRRAS